MSLKVFDPHVYHLEVITPTHIGMAQEKSYLRGIDYVYKDKKVFFLNLDEILKRLDPEQIKKFSSYLASGEINQIESYYITRGFLKEPFIYSAKTQSIAIPSNNEGKINRLYCTGLGKYAIPGSSIKGALKSVLLYHLKNQLGKGTSEEIIFESIENNLMKYIQVGDVLMNGRDMISIYPVKVYSADGYPDRGKGFWKNKTRGGHVNNFDPENFISFYEAYNNGSNGDLKVNLGIDLSHYSSIQAKSAPNYDWFSKNDLISLISNSTKQYLKKELEYFEHYPFDYQTEIKKMLEKLEELNNEDGCCLLRLGAGVGFHSITGDYICPNHIMWEKAAGQIKAKTRKLIFKYQREGWSFFPMGFVKIYNEEAWEKAKGLNKPVTDQELFDNERAQNEKTKEDSEPNEQILPQDLLIKQPRQPVTKDFTQLRDGDTVDAKVVRQEGINVVVELFCTNLTQTTWKFRYAAGFPKNSILELKISFPNRKNRMQFNLTYYKAIIS